MILSLPSRGARDLARRNVRMTETRSPIPSLVPERTILRTEVRAPRPLPLLFSGSGSGAGILPASLGFQPVFGTRARCPGRQAGSLPYYCGRNLL